MAKYDYSAPVLSREWCLANFDYDEETGVVSRKSDGGTGKVGRQYGKETYIKFHSYLDGKHWEIPAQNIAWVLLGRPELAPGITVDHADRGMRNNRPDNLRAATKQQQQANRARPRGEHKLPKGGTYIRSQNRYRARIKVDGRQRYLGHYDCPAAAHFKYLTAADQAFGAFATGG